jgi:K(+)-stimulated pyrophosphate-energized sodium pump
VALNPIIKFTTLFGLLAVEMAVGMIDKGQRNLTTVLAVVFFICSAIFVWRSFYTMRIKSGVK